MGGEGGGSGEGEVWRDLLGFLSHTCIVHFTTFVVLNFPFMASARA